MVTKNKLRTTANVSGNLKCDLFSALWRLSLLPSHGSLGSTIDGFDNPLIDM